MWEVLTIGDTIVTINPWLVFWWIVGWASISVNVRNIAKWWKGDKDD